MLFPDEGYIGRVKNKGAFLVFFCFTRFLYVLSGKLEHSFLSLFVFNSDHPDYENKTEPGFTPVSM